MAVVDKMEIQLTGEVGQLQRAMRDAESAVRGAGSRIEAQLGSLDKAFGQLKTVALGYLTIDFAKSLIATGRAALSAAGDLAELAEQAGVSTDNLQVMIAAGVTAGAKVEDITTGLGRFSRSLANAALEGGSAATAFNKLGVATVATGGGVRDTMEALLDTAEAISKIQSPAQRIQVAMGLLGRGGAKLLPILSQGRDGIERFAAEARKMGLVIGKDGVEAADKLADKFALMELRSQKLNQELMAGLAPALLELIELWNKLKEAMVLPPPELGLLGIPGLSGRGLDAARAAAEAAAIPIPTAKPSPRDRGLMARGKADPVNQFFDSQEESLILARMSGLEREQFSAFFRLKKSGEQSGRTITTADRRRSDSNVERTQEATAATERRVAAEKRLDEALDAQDASMGQLLKTQREVEAKKYALIAAGEEEIANNTLLISALGQSEEAYRIELRYQQLLAQAKRDNIAVTDELIAKLREQAGTEGRQQQTIEKLKDGYEETRRAAQDFANVIGTAFEDAILRGAKFSDVLKSLGQDLARIALRIAITKPFENAVRGLFTGTGGGSSSMGTGGIGSALGALGGVGSLFSGGLGSIGSSLGGMFGFGAGMPGAILSAGGMDAVAAGEFANMAHMGHVGLSSGGFMAGAGPWALGGIAASLIGSQVGGRSGSLISGVGSGAALGATIGSIVPGVGTLIGAGVGALGGALFGGLSGGKPSVGPGGTGGVLMGPGGLYGTMTSGDNGFTGGMVIDLARRSADALSRLAGQLGTSVTEGGVGGFAEQGGRLSFGMNGTGYNNATSAESAVSDYVHAAIANGALAGISEVDERLIAGAVSGMLDQAMAAIEGEKLGRLAEAAARAAEQIDNVANSLRMVVDSLATDESISPLKTGERLAAAQQQFNAAVAAAQGGDLDAAARAGQLGRGLLSVGTEMYARAGGEYRGLYNQVSGDLSGIAGSLGGQAGSLRGGVSAAQDAMMGGVLAAIREQNDNLTRLLTKFGLIAERVAS